MEDDLAADTRSPGSSKAFLIWLGAVQMQVAEAAPHRAHMLRLRNRAAGGLKWQGQGSQLQLGGRSAALADVTEEQMMGDVTFFVVLMGWLGAHSVPSNRRILLLHM